MGRKLVYVTTALMLVAGCGGGSKSTAPKDPNAAMYGTYTGQYQSVTPIGDPGGMQVVLAAGSARCLFGAEFPTTLLGMSDPSVTFRVITFSDTSVWVGTRAGRSITGTYAFPTGGTGTWVVNR
jgi:hypothetical protein